MFKKLFQTENDCTFTLLRLILGIVFFAHGAQKALGWFGGQGLTGTIYFFAQMGIPAPFATLAVAAEFLGGLGLIVGLLARVAALGIITNMAVAIFMVHDQFGFFMNWSGNKPGEGFEYHLLAMTLAGAVVVKGAGAFSVDYVLAAYTPAESSATESKRVVQLRESRPRMR